MKLITKHAIICILIAVAVGVIAIWNYIGTNLFKSSLTTIRSDEYTKLDKKIEVLNRNWPRRTKSPVKDIVYKLVITNGPDPCFYSVAVKVDPKYIDQWLDQYRRDEGNDNIEYQIDFDDIHIPWSHGMKREEYHLSESASYAVVFRQEGVILLYGYE